MSQPLPRTYLFVPGDRPERFAKALASGAGVVVLDLEDAVRATAKPAARQALARFVATMADAPRMVDKPERARRILAHGIS